MEVRLKGKCTFLQLTYLGNYAYAWWLEMSASHQPWHLKENCSLINCWHIIDYYSFKGRDIENLHASGSPKGSKPSFCQAARETARESARSKHREVFPLHVGIFCFCVLKHWMGVRWQRGSQMSMDCQSCRGGPGDVSAGSSAFFKHNVQHPWRRAGPLGLY